MLQLYRSDTGEKFKILSSIKINNTFMTTSKSFLTVLVTRFTLHLPTRDNGNPAPCTVSDLIIDSYQYDDHGVQ